MKLKHLEKRYLNTKKYQARKHRIKSLMRQQKIWLKNGIETFKNKKGRHYNNNPL